MKLWILLPKKNLPEEDNPWSPWYNKAFGFVIIASTEEEARILANNRGGDEWRTRKDPWLSSAYSTCEELLPEGTPRVVLCDLRSA